MSGQSLLHRSCHSIHCANLQTPKDLLKNLKYPVGTPGASWSELVSLLSLSTLVTGAVVKEERLRECSREEDVGVEDALLAMLFASAVHLF